jgi:membrane protein implicated in regulation of membrane protease activity
MLTIAYIAFAVFGSGYIVFAAFMGQLSDIGGDHGHAGGHDAGGHEAAGDYGVDGGGHGVAKAADAVASSFHFPFFSPLALSTLFASIGAYGLIAQFGLRVGEGASLLISVPAAFATAYGVTYASWRLVASSRGSTTIKVGEFAGASGEVITPIPAGGVGEVAAIVGGQRFTAPAREVEGKAVPRGAHVSVVRMTGSTLVVTPAEHKGGSHA